MNPALRIGMLKKLTVSLIGASLVLASGAAVAKNYRIELIVFERTQPQTGGDEQWDFSSERIAERLRQMAALAEQASARATSERVGNLASVRTNLIESGYHILNTTSWQQPASSYRNAPVIPLGRANTALAAGFVRIYTTSLIYADLNLQLTPPSPTPAIDATTVTATTRQPHYFIAEKRRLKFKQIHYFDHPYFGAILGVWPVSG